jgi:hypothetical protein
VWIVPKRSAASANTFPSVPAAAAGEGEQDFLEYGAAIRFFDAHDGKFRAVWAGPRQGKTYVFTARAGGGDEVEMVAREQVGEQERERRRVEGKAELDREGLLMKWHLTEIGEERFKWKEWMSEDEGGSWWLREEFDCVRMRES